MTPPAGTTTLGRREIRRLLDSAGITPSRLRGQNFLVDPNMAERIVRLAKVGAGDRVVEIGAGLGSLTRALSSSGAEVLAVEIDSRLASLLTEQKLSNVTVVAADAMHCDWGEILRPPEDPWVLVANLPYNIATPLIIELLRDVPLIARMVVMVQSEVADRLASAPGTRTYGPSTVRLAYFAKSRVVARISPDVFFPRPKVDSALLAIDRRRRVAVSEDDASFEEIDELVRAGFSSRRKMLRRALEGMASTDVFSCAGVDPTSRAEQLDVLAWGKLAKCRKTITSSRAPS
ncbi:MAG: 16S rRNA (adenine(1518)-N(6)/adenine(1519)-N(6))-dimethyltransferase RsmA [Acidimicrobiales bacterium]